MSARHPIMDPALVEPVVAQLQRAKALLLAQGWVQHWTLAHGIQGPLCLGIALRTANNPAWLTDTRLRRVVDLETSPVGNIAWKAVQRHLGATRQVSFWNDDPKRAFADVLDVLDAAMQTVKDAAAAAWP